VDAQLAPSRPHELNQLRIQRLTRFERAPHCGRAALREHRLYRRHAAAQVVSSTARPRSPSAEADLLLSTHQRPRHAALLLSCAEWASLFVEGGL
jgi:hypothetical protein